MFRLGARAAVVGALVFLATLLASALPATAAAAPAWLSPEPVAGGKPGSGGADVAMAADGRAVVVWSTNDHKIQAAVRTPGGPWSAPVDLGQATSCCPQPEVAMDGSGRAIAVFEAWGATDSRVWVRTLAPGDTAWTGAQDISGAGFARTPQLGVDPAGNALIAWSDTAGGYHELARYRAADGSLGPLDPISSIGACCPRLDVAMAGDGTGVVVWDQYASNVFEGYVQARARSANGSWTPALANPPQQLAGPFSASFAFDAHVAADAKGNALATWRAPDGTATAAARSTAGGWGPAQPLSPAVNNSAPWPAMDADGLATVAWCQPALTSWVVQVRRRPVGAPFAPAVPVSEPEGTKCSPQVAASSGGAAVVLWANPDGLIRGNIRPAGGDFGAARDISVLGGSLFASAAFDARGDAIAAWHRNSTDPNQPSGVQAAGYDATPPEARDVIVPASATTGVALGMSVTAFDVWSAVSVTWDFGDGTGATGAAVSHAFRAAGRYDVTLTLTDAVGNTSSAKRTVVVTDPPVAPVTPRINSTVQSSWGYDSRTGKKFILLRLKVKRPPTGSAAQLRCSGKRCPFQSRRFAKIRKRDITLYRSIKPAKAAKQKKRRFRAGQRVELRITARGYIGKVVRYKLKKRKQPVGRVLCLAPGAGKPTKCTG